MQGKRNWPTSEVLIFILIFFFFFFFFLHLTLFAVSFRQSWLDLFHPALVHNARRNYFENEALI